VETPEIYIVVRSGSSDVEQLTYIDTYLECLEELSINIKTSGGNDVRDKMCFFHGDSPAHQLESGQQKGGKFDCSGCGANAQQAHHILIIDVHLLSVQQLLTTLVEIQRIAYSSESERTPKSVLRLHNMTWYPWDLVQVCLVSS
jgi:hypothetical protein